MPGRFSQGAIAAGWVVAVAVNHRLHVAGFSEHACDAPVICGDFGDLVLPDIWKQSHGISSWRFGLSCQPFSPLGDGRGPHDDRAWGLSLTMAATNSPQSWIMVIGCASPAGADAAANPNGMQCTGCPGPVRSGSWNDGCAVSHLYLGYSGLYQHTTWFITVLIQSLQHRLVGLSVQASRWYGDAVVRQLVSWFWFSFQDCTCPLVLVPHFHLCIDFTLSMGSPGLVHLGSGKDGSDMVNLHLRGFGSKRRTMWFITVLKAWLRHRQIRLTMGHGRSAPTVHHLVPHEVAAFCKSPQLALIGRIGLSQLLLLVLGEVGLLLSRLPVTRRPVDTKSVLRVVLPGVVISLPPGVSSI